MWCFVFGYQYQCNWLPGKTCLQNVSSGTLNPTQSPTYWLRLVILLTIFSRNIVSLCVSHIDFKSACTWIKVRRIWMFWCWICRYWACGVANCAVKLSAALHRLYCRKSSDQSLRILWTLFRTNNTCISSVRVIWYYVWYSEAQVLRFPGLASNKLGEWLIEWLSMRFFSLGDEDDARMSNTCIVQRKRTIPHDDQK